MVHKRKPKPEPKPKRGKPEPNGINSKHEKFVQSV